MFSTSTVGSSVLRARTRWVITVAVILGLLLGTLGVGVVVLGSAIVGGTPPSSTVPPSDGPVHSSTQSPHGPAGLAMATVQDPTQPSKRWGAAMTNYWGTGHQQLLLFSGSNGHINVNGTAYGDTWAYSSGSWTQLPPTLCTSPTCPLARTYAGLANYSYGGERFAVLFGGAQGPTFLRDTWVYNASTSQWKNITPSPLNSTNSPPAFDYVSMVWDPVDHFDVLYGGCTFTGCNFNSEISNQTWAFEGVVDQKAHWVNLTEPSPLPALYSPALTYDVKDKYVLLFGGVTVRNDELVYTNQTWTYNVTSGWVNHTARQESPTNTPSTRVWSAMAYYPPGRETVLFGGQENQNKTNNPTLNDTWTYAGGTWTNITADLSLSPHGRFGGVMAYDPYNNTLVLFGGLSATLVGSPVLDDTWWFSGVPGTWAEHGLPPTTNSGSSGQPLLEYSLIGVAVAAVVVGALLIVLRRRRKKSRPPTVSAESESTAQRTGPEGPQAPPPPSR